MPFQVDEYARSFGHVRLGNRQPDAYKEQVASHPARGANKENSVEMEQENLTLEDWVNQIDFRLFDSSRRPLECALKALDFYPGDGMLLEYAAFAALVEESRISASVSLRDWLGITCRFPARLPVRLWPWPSRGNGRLHSPLWRNWQSAAGLMRFCSPKVLIAIGSRDGWRLLSAW